MPLSAPEWPVDGDGITAASFHFQFPTKVTQYILASWQRVGLDAGLNLESAWNKKSAPQPTQGTHCLVSMFCHREQHHSAYSDQNSSIRTHSDAEQIRLFDLQMPRDMETEIPLLEEVSKRMWCWLSRTGQWLLTPSYPWSVFPHMPTRSHKVSKTETWERNVLLRSSGPNTRLNWVKASVSTWKILVVGARIYLVLQCPRQASYVPPLAY